jgi:hypothetical protein
MNIRRLLGTAAMTAGLAIGLAATANAAPVCCVFYGGDYDERTGECWIDRDAKLEEANPGPSVPPKHPVLTRVDRMPVYALG